MQAVVIHGQTTHARWVIKKAYTDVASWQVSVSPVESSGAAQLKSRPLTSPAQDSTCVFTFSAPSPCSQTQHRAHSSLILTAGRRPCFNWAPSFPGGREGSQTSLLLGTTDTCKMEIRCYVFETSLSPSHQKPAPEKQTQLLPLANGSLPLGPWEASDWPPHFQKDLPGSCTQARADPPKKLILQYLSVTASPRCFPLSGLNFLSPFIHPLPGLPLEFPNLSVGNHCSLKQYELF